MSAATLEEQISLLERLENNWGGIVAWARHEVTQDGEVPRSGCMSASMTGTEEAETRANR